MGKDLIIRGLNKAVFLLRKTYAILFGKRKIYVFNWYNWVKIDYERYLKKVVNNSFVQIITRYKFYKTYDKGKSDSYNVKIAIDDFKDFSYQNYKLWEICKSSILDELIKSGIETKSDLSIVKKYYRKSISLIDMVRKFIIKERPYAILVEQGFQYDMRTFVEVGRRSGVKTIAVENSFIKDKFFMDAISGGICNRHYLARNSWDILKGREISDDQRLMTKKTMKNYISQVERGDPVSKASILKEASGKKTMLILGQVATDASIIMDSPVFNDMLEFIYRCISEMNKYSNEWFTIVRLHPKESYGQNHHGSKFENRTLQSLLKLGADKLDHVKIYHSEEVNTYELMDIVDCGITINSQAGLELLSRYKPVITAGDAFYSGKGFTFDVNRKELLPEVIKIALNNVSFSEQQKKNIDKFIYFMVYEYMYPKQIQKGEKLRELLI